MVSSTQAALPPAGPSLHALAGALAMFLLLGFNQLSAHDYGDVEVAALSQCSRPLGEIAASREPDLSPAFLLLLRQISATTRGEELPTRGLFVVLGCGVIAAAWHGARSQLPAEWALMAVFLMALSPALLTAARQVGPWIPTLLAALLAIDCMIHALRGPAPSSAEPTGAARGAIGWWSGAAVLAGLAAALHPLGLVPVLAALVVTLPEARERRTQLGLLGVGVGVALALALCWPWASQAYPALLAAPTGATPLPRTAAGDAAVGYASLLRGLTVGELAGVWPERLHVALGLVYAGMTMTGAWQLIRAGVGRGRVALLCAIALGVVQIALPGGQVRSAALLTPFVAVAAATGLMFLPRRACAVAVLVLLTGHLVCAQRLATGQDLMDPSLREPHRERAALLSRSIQASDALLLVGDVGPMLRLFREKPVTFRVEFGPEGAAVQGRKDPAPEAFLAGMRYERRAVWVVMRYPADRAARATFHARWTVFRDWLAATVAVADRLPAPTTIPHPAGGAGEVPRCEMFLIDPARPPK